jgi:hypothetical protein
VAVEALPSEPLRNIYIFEQPTESIRRTLDMFSFRMVTHSPAPNRFRNTDKTLR